MHSIPRSSRVLSRVLPALLALLLLGSAGAAEWTPSRPIRLLVPYTAGGAADVGARLLAEKLGPALGQPVVVDNRGGASGVIGTDAAAKSQPDGYTLVWGSDVAFTIVPQLQPVGYDPLRDFEPVSLFMNGPLVLVVNPQKVPVASVQELVALAKASPGKYSIASSGNGSSHHFAAEMLKYRAGVNLLHVPYKGGAQAVTDLLGGQVDMMLISLSPLAAHLKSGKLKALAVSTTQRMSQLPDVPTLAEAGVPGYDIGVWMGVLYPARTPKPIVDRVTGEIAKILDQPDVRMRLAAMGYTPGTARPEDLSKRLDADTAAYRKLIVDAKIKLD
jgi:tripartite-type tricarboxylate transporter receptor subunit TctC